MKGDWEIVLLAFVLMIVFVSLMIAGVSGKPPPEGKATTTEQKKYCKTDNDCSDDANGKRCLLIYPGDFIPFCGCLTNNDCAVGICGQNNICS
jgi:hypothetical protein